MVLVPYAAGLRLWKNVYHRCDMKERKHYGPGRCNLATLIAFLGLLGLNFGIVAYVSLVPGGGGIHWPHFWLYSVPMGAPLILMFLNILFTDYDI